MKRIIRHLSLSIVSLVVMLSGVMSSSVAHAAAPPAENPQSGSTGLTGSIPSAPPKTAPTITAPTSGQTFTNTPITVSGLCTSGLLVKVFDNNVFMGSVMCANGSYSLKVDLFSGQNDLVARSYDALDQASPDSNIVRITFNDQNFTTTNTTSMYVTSDYARRGANPGETLLWPLILVGGTGPYAVSVDWGDGKTTDLFTLEFSGQFNIKHVYDSAGIYTIIVKVTDKNGLTTFLQLVGVANGAITSASGTNDNKQSILTITKVIWQPSVILLPLIALSFWLGRRYELSSLRKHLENVEY